MNCVLLTLLSFGFITINGIIEGESHEHLHWHDSPMCSGATQSPINIDTNNLRAGHYKCSPELDWNFKAHQDFKIYNTGHSLGIIPVQLHGNNTYTSLNTNTTAIATFKNQWNKKTGVHDKYCLHQIHFHWGATDYVGSEHTINRARYELEIHFVHFSCDYKDVKGAVYPSNNNITEYDPYTLGVIGVMAHFSNKDNPAFEKILSVLEEVVYPPGVDSHVHGEAFVTDLDLSDLIPKPIKLDYYGYEGSLTTPPCNPIVRWHVLQNSISISEHQLAKFRKIRYNETITQSNNYREIQNNNNPVYQCIQIAGVKQQNILIAIILSISMLFFMF